MKKVLGAAVMGCATLMGACDADVAERTVKNGDTVVIDFAGFMGDVQFAGGTAENFPLKIGSGMFVPGFEEQLVGAKLGEKRDVNITFPKNYYPELAGKDVVFKVTIKDFKD